jgi:DNA-binding transcriptional regulator YdaS (Cro superfamily)
MNALEKAISIAGSQTALAQRVGTKQQNVSQWAKSRVSPEFVIGVSRAIDFMVTPHELRPDLYPNPTDGLPAQSADREAA